MAMKLMIQKADSKGNVVVMGKPLSGKTVWVNSQVDKAKTLFISTDGNALAGCKIALAENYEDLIEAIEYAVGRDDMETIVLDLLDDAVAFAEERAQRKLGMSGKADMKGAYNRFTNTVGEIVKENILRPLLMSGKEVYVVLHSETKDGDEVPCFGSFSSDATNILNWLKGRCRKVVLCTNYSGVYTADVIAERTIAPVEKEAACKPEPKGRKPKVEEQVLSEEIAEKTIKNNEGE
jgi:hypothetical protein